MRARLGWAVLLFAVLAILARPDPRLDAQEILSEPKTSEEEFVEPVLITDFDETSAAQADEFESDVGVPAWGDWQVRFGALLLNRTGTQQHVLSNHFYFRDSRINASDFDFPLSAASDIGLRLPGELFDLDFRYFGVQNATAEIGPVATSERGLYYWSWYNFPPPNYPVTTRAALTSSLQSAELNLRGEWLPRLSWLVGFRYLQFRERLRLTQDVNWPISGTMTTGYDVSGRNELFGLQFGNECLLWDYRNRLRVDAFIKAGVFGNAASSSQYSFYSFSSSPQYNWGHSWSAERGGLALMSEVSLSASFRIRDHVTLRAGYELLVLSDTATAIEQFGNSRTTFRTNDLEAVLFHGALVGLECAW